jgi:hypothetical protein
VKQVRGAGKALPEIGRDLDDPTHDPGALFMTDDDAFRQRVLSGMSAATGGRLRKPRARY